jgi:hypothetical protein
MTIDNRSPPNLPQGHHVRHNARLHKLESLGWRHDETSGRHQICAERCDWIAGKISGVEWSAWISEVSGMVYLHGVASTPGGYDFEFDAFCALVKNGWPEVNVPAAVRSLFGDD